MRMHLTLAFVYGDDEEVDLETAAAWIGKDSFLETLVFLFAFACLFASGL